MLFLYFYLLSNVSQPFNWEILDKPIYLEGKCAQIKIIESKPLSVEDKQKINKTCDLVMDEVEEFLQSRNLNLKMWRKDVLVSFLPRDGFRSLNDFDFRFKNRKDFGRVYGFFQRNENWMALIPPDTPYFEEVFAHELFHALVWNNGITSLIREDFSKRDEELAREFTKYLEL